MPTEELRLAAYSTQSADDSISEYGGVWPEALWSLKPSLSGIPAAIIADRHFLIGISPFMIFLLIPLGHLMTALSGLSCSFTSSSMACRASAPEPSSDRKASSPFIFSISILKNFFILSENSPLSISLSLKRSLSGDPFTTDSIIRLYSLSNSEPLVFISSPLKPRTFPET